MTNQTTILTELIRLKKDSLALIMVKEYKLPKAMIAGYDIDPAATDKTGAKWEAVSSPLAMALKNGQSGLAIALMDKGADIKRVTHGDTHILKLATMHGGKSLLDCVDKHLPAADMQALLKSYCDLPTDMGERPSAIVPLLQKHKIAKEHTDRFAAKWENVFTSITYDKHSRQFSIPGKGETPFTPPVTHWVDEFTVRDLAATTVSLQKAGLGKAAPEAIGKILVGLTGDEYRGPAYLEHLKNLHGDDQKRKDSFLADAVAQDEVIAAKALIASGAKGTAVSMFDAIWREKPETVRLLAGSGMKLDSVNATKIGSPAESHNQPLIESTLIFNWASKEKFEMILNTLATTKGITVKDDAQYFQAVSMALAEPKKAALVSILQQGGLPFPTQGKNKLDLLETIEAKWAEENATWGRNNPGLDRFTNDPCYPQMIIDRANLKQNLLQWKGTSLQRNNVNLGAIQLDKTFQLVDGTAAPAVPLDMAAIQKQALVA